MARTFLFRDLALVKKALGICPGILVNHDRAVFQKDQNITGIVLILWLEIGMYIFVGVRGNDWHAANLQKRGFELIDTVQAETPGAAIGKVAKT